MGSTTPARTLRLGTRGSMLAKVQSGMVAQWLEARHPGLSVELITLKTTGDQITDRPLYDSGGKGLFTKELEQALIAGEIDCAVHSFKDVPVTMPLIDTAGLTIAAVPQREDVRDVLVAETATTLRQLPPGSRVGTGSLRRRCQILAIRPDLKVELIRGNIDTRLKKRAAGMYDAIVLAYAGLRRSGLFDGGSMTPIELDDVLPAAAQGALAIQCRRDDPATCGLLSVLDDPSARQCVEVERAVVQVLNGDCHSPIAALAQIQTGRMRLCVAVGRRGGEPPVVTARAEGPADAWQTLVSQTVAELESKGVRAMLA